MKVIVKGGVWKNTEDEILKVAVMKYGKNQWARISSLLTRKTPKQCKARWYEWLDPSIKKTEWSKEEDEKLLHLAKLMPTQWRTIAPIVGRTAAQCLERYQKLLDEAEEGEEGEKGITGEDVRKLRPGEIDPDPETKPARPDPVDMDEDEREMLSEARARLANTQGKKAKRKARERQLEEARRMSAIQKRRELKSAGILIGLKKYWKGMNLNADIPFHKKAPVGFHDISEEIEKESSEKRNLVGTVLSKLEGKRKAEIEAEERRKDAKKIKQQKASGEYLPAQAMKEAKEREAAAFANRKKLILPEPQMKDEELQEIIKIGKVGQVARSVIESAAASSEDFSKGLLSNYESGITVPTATRTPRMPETEDSLKAQARNLRAMTEAQTPLLGGSMELEGEVNFESAAPKRQVVSTPNPMMAHLTPRNEIVSMTPRPESRTPMRDEMRINTPSISGSEFSDDGSWTPRPESISSSVQGQIRRDLRDLFAELPKPKNDFEIVLPDQIKDKSIVDKKRMDAEDRDSFERRLMTEQEEAEFKRRSSAVRKDLPRPLTLKPIHLGKDKVNQLVAKEMDLMLLHDAIHFPVPGSKPVNEAGVELEIFKDSFLDEAMQLIEEEMKNIEFSAKDFEVEHEQLSHQYTFIPKPKPRFIKNSSSKKELIDGYTILLETYREKMKLDATLAQKQEKKLGVLLGGYMNRSRKISEQIVQKWQELQDLKIERQSLMQLKTMETNALQQRLEKSKKEFELIQLKDKEKQGKYAALKMEEESLLQP